MRRLRALLTVIAVLLTAVPAIAVADNHEDCVTFNVTNTTLCGVFKDFWEGNGGLPVFGYPMTDAANEQNYDTGVTSLAQYFERQRFEHHPEFAGTIYEVLLGRLGAQVLELHGRNWHAFPKADPGTMHYVPQTGHAIAPEFYAYYTSHGLDLGDPGISWRESVMLFGYPISGAAVETNADGDTVLTQWFERAAFELHPDNPPQHRVLLRRVGWELLTWDDDDGHIPPPDGEPVIDLYLSGLNNPRHMTFANNGDLYITEAGTGGNTCADVSLGLGDGEACFGMTGGVVVRRTNEQASRVVNLPSFAFGEETIGTHDVHVADDGTLWVLMGLGGNPAERANFPIGGNVFGHLIRVHQDGTWESILDVAAYEAAHNPDGGEVDSNPFAMAVTEDGIAIADAGANALLWVDNNLNVSTLAVFPPVMMLAPPFLGLPEGTEIPAQAVPTGVVQGPDGAFYVSMLTGFPFQVGKASVWRVTKDGHASVYAEGFTNLIDVAFDAYDRLLVLEAISGGLLNVDPGNPPTVRGKLVRIEANGDRTVLVHEGLVFPTGLAVRSGVIYIGNFGVMPGLGQILRVTFQ